VDRSPLEVVLLTQADCAFCHDAEDILDHLSAEYGFVVTRLDLDTPKGQETAIRGGVLFPPGILIDGEPFSYGRPSERRLRTEFERRRQPLWRR
jgi:glutaredoxin